MQLGLTWPLQRLLKTAVPYGEELDRRYCWDAHSITLHGSSSLLLVHCWSRFACIRFGMSRYDWESLADIVKAEVEEGFSDADIAPERIARYFEQAGEIQLTRTHGRREVAFLNRTWDSALALDLLVDTSSHHQPLLNHALNARPCRCAGEEPILSAREHLLRCFVDEIF